MDKQRDLAWWQIRRWAPATTRVLATGLVFGLVFGLVVGLITELVFGFYGFGAYESNPLGPREMWYEDRITGLAHGLMFGIALMPGFGLVGMLMFGLVGGFVLGLVGGLVVGLVSALIFPQTWPTTLAWLQLRLSSQVPAVRLMPFLEDTRERGVLRTVGGVYQFRHASLQDQLAEQATPVSVVSRAA